MTLDQNGQRWWNVAGKRQEAGLVAHQRPSQLPFKDREIKIQGDKLQLIRKETVDLEEPTH